MGLFVERGGPVDRAKAAVAFDLPEAEADTRCPCPVNDGERAQSVLVTGITVRCENEAPSATA